MGTSLKAQIPLNFEYWIYLLSTSHISKIFLQDFLAGKINCQFFQELRLSKVANEKHMLNMCSQGVSLLGKKWYVLHKKIVLLITKIIFKCVLQENFGKIWPIFFLWGFLSKVWCVLRNFLTIFLLFWPPGNLSNLSFLAGEEQLFWRMPPLTASGLYLKHKKIMKAGVSIPHMRALFCTLRCQFLFFYCNRLKLTSPQRIFFQARTQN